MSMCSLVLSMAVLPHLYLSFSSVHTTCLCQSCLHVTISGTPPHISFQVENQLIQITLVGTDIWAYGWQIT